MKQPPRLIPAVAASALAAVVLVVGLPAFATDSMTMNPKDIKWSDAPPTLPKGAKIAVLSGDPGKPGPFVIRLKAPARYWIAPHWHSQTENLTVISGTLYLGMGEKLDKKSVHPLTPGGFHYLPAKTNHYAFTKDPAIVQIHGDGPFDITYVNAADDPSKK